MGITSFKLITLDEYKDWDGYDSFMGERAELIQNQDNYLNEAITTASSQLDILSGNRLGKEFSLLDPDNDTSVINDIKLACALQTRFLQRKGIEYLSGSDTVSSSTINFSFTQLDTFEPRPEVIQLLKKNGYYIDIVYINNSNESPNYNDHRHIKPRITTGDTGLTWNEARGYFISKVGGIVSDTGTISIKDAPRPADNGVSVSIDLTIEAVKSFAPEVAPEVISILVTDSEFQDLIQKGVDLYLELNMGKIAQATSFNLLQNQDFLNLIASNEIIQNKIKEVVESLKPEIKDYVASELLNDYEWKEEVVNAVPPISQESFNTLLSTSNIFNIIPQWYNLDLGNWRDRIINSGFGLKMPTVLGFQYKIEMQIYNGYLTTTTTTTTTATTTATLFFERVSNMNATAASATTSATTTTTTAATVWLNYDESYLSMGVVRNNNSFIGGFTPPSTADFNTYPFGTYKLNFNSELSQTFDYAPKIWVYTTKDKVQECQTELNNY